MKDSLTGDTLASEHLFKDLAELRLELAGATDLKHAVNRVARRQGQAETLRGLEQQEDQLITWAAKQGWSAERVLMVRYAQLTTAALQDPNDEYGGRINDFQRSYNDGRREILNDHRVELRERMDRLYFAEGARK